MLNVCIMCYTPSPFYHVNLQHSSSKHVVSIRVENNVDPDQMASQEPADLDLSYFLKKINLDSAEQGKKLKSTFMD